RPRRPRLRPGKGGDVQGRRPGPRDGPHGRAGPLLPARRPHRPRALPGDRCPHRGRRPRHRRRPPCPDRRPPQGGGRRRGVDGRGRRRRLRVAQSANDRRRPDGARNTMVRCNVVSTMTRPDVVAEIAKWFGSRVPADWFRGPPELTVDGEEILVAGELADRPGGGRRPSAARSRRVSAGGAAASGAVEEAETIKAFREATREARVRIASDAERRFGRKVSWGASCGETSILFTTVSVPVMTRLRIAERRVLDPL